MLSNYKNVGEVISHIKNINDKDSAQVGLDLLKNIYGVCDDFCPNDVIIKIDIYQKQN